MFTLELIIGPDGFCGDKLPDLDSYPVKEFRSFHSNELCPLPLSCEGFLSPFCRTTHGQSHSPAKFPSSRDPDPGCMERSKGGAITTAVVLACLQESTRDLKPCWFEGGDNELYPILPGVL